MLTDWMRGDKNLKQVYKIHDLRYLSQIGSYLKLGRVKKNNVFKYDNQVKI